MKRAGFTMIELIFVIVILGILAAVAVPKLAATRDDAKNSGMKAQVGTAISSVPATFMARKVASFTESMKFGTASWVLDATGCIATFTDDATDTIVMSIVQDVATAPTGGCGGTTVNVADDNVSLQIVYTATVGTSTVGTLVNEMSMNDINITLGGTSVVY